MSLHKSVFGVVCLTVAELAVLRQLGRGSQTLQILDIMFAAELAPAPPPGSQVLMEC